MSFKMGRGVRQNRPRAHVAGSMPHFPAAPRKGHLWIVLHIFAYCKKHNDSKIMFAPIKNDMEPLIGLPGIGHSFTLTLLGKGYHMINQNQEGSKCKYICSAMPHTQNVMGQDD
jgi:hypothetical protein